MKSNYFLAFLEEAACVGCSPPSVHPSIHPVFHPSVYLSISIPLLAILSLFLYTVLGFNHCCNWQLPAVLTHTCIHFLCALLLQIPLAISYVCVSVRARVLVSVCVPARVCVCVRGQEREIWRDKDNERSGVSELQANSPVCLLWSSLRKLELCSQIVIIWEKKDMAQDLLENTTLCWTYCGTMMLPQLCQFNNWPCQAESVPRNRYLHQSNMVQEMGLLQFCHILRVWTATRSYFVIVLKEFIMMH